MVAVGLTRWRHSEAAGLTGNDICWGEHAQLFALAGSRRKLLMSGQLHALVGLALGFAGGLDGTVIETDSGRMFCRDEIRYLGLDATRPAA